MKIKNIKKSILVILTICLMLLSVLAFAGCKEKQPYPKTLTVEQARAVLEEAVTKAKTATNIYMVDREDKEGEFTYADANTYYFQRFENESNKKLLRKSWYKYENLIWTRYDYYYLENGELNSKHEQQFDDKEDTSYTEMIWGQFELWAEIPFSYDYTITATQVSENKIIITLQEFESEYQGGIRIEIVDGYIEKAYEVYGDEVYWDYGISYAYNVEGLEIPPIPNEE